MSDDGAMTGAMAGVVASMAAEQARRAEEAEARRLMETFDPKSASIEERRAYAKAVLLVDGDGEPATIGDRIGVAVFMLSVAGGAAWGWFHVAPRIAVGSVGDADRLIGSGLGAVGAFLALFLATAIWAGLSYVFAGRKP